MNYENKELCKECGGMCCKSLPGACFPDDFNSSNDLIRKAIESGKYTIDCWEGDPGDGIEQTAFYVRPATVGKEGQTYDYSWGGCCVFLGDNGCILNHDDRPKECRSLEPAKDGCIKHDDITKRKAAIAWRPYFDLLNSF